MRYHLRSAGVLLLLMALASMALAQTSRGTLTGTVTDSSGAVVTNATVKITQTGTNVNRQTTTNSAGIYRFDAVDLGTYTVSVQAPGFATADKTGVEISAAHTLSIDFSMKVGNTKEVVTVEASGAEIALQTSEQVRGETLSTLAVTNLPLIAGDSLTLVQLAPGVALGSSNSINQNGNLTFAVNGQRPRGNNFMIDGVENNHISVTGPAFTITIPDAVTEVSVQTANFSAEFGRSGGAVINQVTNSGTNAFHGSAAYVYTGSAFQTLNHTDVLAKRTRPPRSVENIPDFTFGGPVIIPHFYNGHNKTFFFAAAQWDRNLGATTSNIRVPDSAGVAVLQSLSAQCPNAALYLKALGSVRGNAGPNQSISLAVPSAAGTCNSSTRSGLSLTTGLFGRSESFSSLDNNHLIRVDHTASNKQTMSFRWLYDSSVTGPSLNNLPGFDRNFTGKTMNGLFSDTYMISPRWTNEFRFNYGRIGFNFPLLATDSFHATLPNYAGLGVAGMGGATNIPQFRYANNWQYQDTMSLVRGKHTFRFGVDFLRQLARQHPPFIERGAFTYAGSGSNSPPIPTVSAFANFLDDFGGNSGNLNRQFGSSIYYPNLFRQAYFFQDSWKTTGNLTLNLGLRYELYGAPENTFNVAAFTNYDPVNFAAPHKVASYKNDWGPSVGFAFNPKGDDWFHRMMGGEKMVWRGGFQISYDSAFNNLLSNIAGSSPNTLGTIITSVQSVGTPRGSAGFTTTFNGIGPVAPTALSPQQNLFLTPFPNPQTDRWSLGFEREMPYGLIWDTSYVGSVSHHLYRTIDMNPLVNGVRFQPQVGVRTVRAASANSNYEALQFELKRSFKPTPVGQVLLLGSYTYSHALDDVSDVFGFDSTPNAFQSVSQVLGASPHIDYGNSDFDRRHVGVIALVWGIRGPNHGVLGQMLGGWQVSSVAHWQTGFPFTMANGSDRNKDGQSGPDRPDISNLNAPINTRATIDSGCPLGYSNPDVFDGSRANKQACWDPSTVHWIEGIGLPNARTVRRNTMLAPGLDNLNLSIAKTFKFTERTNMEYRLDMFNALNTANFGNFVAPRTVNSNSVTPAGQATTFLDVMQTESFGRSMRMRLKLTF